MWRQPPRLSGEAKRAAPRVKAGLRHRRETWNLLPLSFRAPCFWREEPASRSTGTPEQFVGPRVLVAKRRYRILLPPHLPGLLLHPPRQLLLVTDKFLRDPLIAQPNHLRRQNPRIRRPRLSNRNRRHRNPRRHLHRRQ